MKHGLRIMNAVKFIVPIAVVFFYFSCTSENKVQQQQPDTSKNIVKRDPNAAAQKSTDRDQINTDQTF